MNHSLAPSPAMPLPPIIQGGMGVGVSAWRLARAVSRLGQLGVVSGTVIDTVLVRRLQDGDPGGHVREAMAAFPLPGTASEVVSRFFRPSGRAPGQPYALLPPIRHPLSHARERLNMMAAFVEVWLARQGHDGVVGINLLTKVQLPNLALLYGAMLAGVDFVLMGAGIPRDVPAALDALSRHESAMLRPEVEGDAGSLMLHLDPVAHWSSTPAPLKRPWFLPIVASNSLATMLARKASGRVDGLIIEGPTAGGHNAPPRGRPPAASDEPGAAATPAYGPRDEVDLAKIHELGLPFWVAGGEGSPARLRAAQAAGAVGIQVGTLFAWCEESDIAPEIRARVLAGVRRGDLTVRTDFRASPTGYPFKVVSLTETPPEAELEPADDSGTADAGKRERICDLGYLRSMYVRPDGAIGYRCASEPILAYEAKGGAVEDTPGRLCLCNMLLATIGRGQVRSGGRVEPPLITSGDDLERLGIFLGNRTSYHAADVVAYLLGDGTKEAGANRAGAVDAASNSTAATAEGDKTPA